MRIVMIKTSYCMKCKEMLPMIRDLCSTRGVGLEVYDATSDKGKEYIELLRNMTPLDKVPVLVFYNDYSELVKVTEGSMTYKEINEVLDSMR